MAETMLENKPYDFVPLVESCQRDIAKGHNQIYTNKTYSGKLELKLTALSPLHIGQGILGLSSDAEIANKMIRRGGKIVIPGSSMKGVIRSIVEAVSHSCAPKSPAPKVSRLNFAFPVNNNKQCNSNKLCPSCSIFGMMSRDFSYRGKVKFGEFQLVQGEQEFVRIPDLSSPFRDYPKPSDYFRSNDMYYGNERIYYCMACEKRNDGECYQCHKNDYHEKRNSAGTRRHIKFRGRKFYFHNINNQESGNPQRTSLYEVVRQGSVFKGSVNFENLSEIELSILSFSLGLDKSFNHKIGFGKPAFYGSVEIELENVEDLISKYKRDQHPIDMEFIMDKANSYYNSCDREIKGVIEKLRHILNKDNAGPMWPVVNNNKVY